jgi:hypothetical protein
MGYAPRENRCFELGFGALSLVLNDFVLTAGSCKTDYSMSAHYTLGQAALSWCALCKHRSGCTKHNFPVSCRR